MQNDEINELREEIQQHNKKAKRITADYQREMEATWNRCEDSYGEVERWLAKTYINGYFGMAYTDMLRDTYEVTEEGIILKPEEAPEKFLEDYQGSISHFIPYVRGCKIITLGRAYLQKMIDAAGPDFCYCDTDSIFATNPDIVRQKIKALEEELTAYQRR